MTRKFEQSPFLPYVSLEQILEYDPARPETHTAAPLVNAVCEKWFYHPAMSVAEMAKCLVLDGKYMSATLKVETGYSAADIRLELQIKVCRQLMKKNPKWKLKDLMPILGLHNATSMWRFVQSHGNHFPEILEKNRLNRFNR